MNFSKQILRLPEVTEKVGLSSSSIWRLAKQGQFPRPIKIGLRAVGWLVTDINAWLAERQVQAMTI